jgi:hypothetical protein
MRVRYIYCAQDTIGGPDGMVGQAGADTCCTPPDPPAGTVLFDREVATASMPGSSICYTDAIDVPNFHSLVVHSNPAIYEVQWSWGVAGWTTQSFADNPSLLTLDGRQGKQVRFAYANGSCQPVKVTVVGFKQ